MSVIKKIVDLDTFLVYSIVLEEEAAERHDELADMLDVHNNSEVAVTFRQLAEYSRMHAQEIRDHAKDRILPDIAPWDFGWDEAEGPETGDIGDVHYLMNTAQALRLAIGNEQRAHDFYAQISRESDMPEVAALAATFAAEEQEHLDLLREWMDRTPASVDEQRFDPDPAHMPE
jgi:rubrerythrin